MISLQTKAEQAHPHNESHQAKWLEAVGYLGDNWVLLKPTAKLEPKPVRVVEVPPPMAHKVTSIIRKRAQTK